MLSRISTDAVACSLVCLLSAICIGGLLWPLPLQLNTHTSEGFFQGGHVWMFDHIHQMIIGERPLDIHTQMLGYPGSVRIKPIAMAPAVLASSMRWALGPIGAYNATLILVFPLSTGIAFAFLRSLSIARWTAGAAALLITFNPFVLGCLASGQVAKIQTWTLMLLALGWSLSARGRWMGIPVTLLAAPILLFSSPSLALWAPFLLVAVILVHLCSEGAKENLNHKLLAMTITAAITLFCFVLAKDFYSASPINQTNLIDAFVPAVDKSQQTFAPSTQVATIEQVFQGMTTPSRPNWRTVYHISTIGSAVWICSLLSVTNRRAFICFLLGCLGVAFSFGPVLTTTGKLFTVQGNLIVMPAHLLNEWGYPTALSGMYYRAAILGSIGLTVAAALGVSRWRWGAALMWGCLLVQCLEIGRNQSSLWPRVLRPVAGVGLLDSIKIDGAVLTLPMLVDDGEGSLQMRSAVLHGAPTNALPRNQRAKDLLFTQENLRHLQDALDIGGDDGRRRLQEAGYAGVTWLEGIGRPAEKQQLSALKDLLGEPVQGEGILFWRLRDTAEK